jgi:hypothetical protein
VFLALGGTTLALSLPKKSVGPKQLKKNAVTKKKIRGGAVTGEKLAGDAVTTEKLAEGAVTTGKLTPGAVTGQALADAAVTEAKISPSAIPLLGNLRTGQTLRGSFNAGGRATVVEDNTRQGISYPFPLAEAAPSTVIGLSDATTANCPSRNPPEAVVGRLCIYVNGVSNVDGSTVATENNGRFGFGIRVDSSTAIGDYGASGVWAVSGPVPGMTP